MAKVPKVTKTGDGLALWLALLNAKTEKDLEQIKTWGDPIMDQAIKAYQQVTATDEFKELERLRLRARANEASALRHATEKERDKWKNVVADKEATIADQKTTIADQNATIARLQAQLGQK